jgi:hypothetical protein
MGNFAHDFGCIIKHGRIIPSNYWHRKGETQVESSQNSIIVFLFPQRSHLRVAPMAILYAFFTVASIIATVHAFWIDSSDKLHLSFTTLILAYIFSTLEVNYEMFRQEEQRSQIQSDRYDYFLNHRVEISTDKAMHV